MVCTCLFIFTSPNIFQTSWPISARVGRDHQCINDIPAILLKSHRTIVSPQLRETLLREHNPSRQVRIHWRQSFPKKKLYSSLDTSFETQVCGKPHTLWAGTQSDAFGGHFSFHLLHFIWQQLAVSSQLVWSAHIVLYFPLNIKVHSLESAVSTFCALTCKERNSGSNWTGFTEVSGRGSYLHKEHRTPKEHLQTFTFKLMFDKKSSPYPVQFLS